MDIFDKVTINRQESKLSDGHFVRLVCLIFISFVSDKKFMIQKWKMVLNHVFQGLPHILYQLVFLRLFKTFCVTYYKTIFIFKF